MSATYTQLQQRYSALTQREKVLVPIAGVACLLLLAFFLLLEPLYLANAGLNKQIQAQRNAISQIDNQIAQLDLATQQDPNQQLREQIAQIKQRITETNQRINRQTQDLVPAGQMLKVLESLLSKTRNIQLLQLTSIPPKVSEEEAQVLFKQGVKLKVQGSYFDVLAYLEKLEALPWQFYWQQFSYQVTEYPEAEVELHLYTLSTSEAFIDV